jgi:hypothetical protein
LDLLVTGGTGTNAEIWLGNDFSERRHFHHEQLRRLGRISSTTSKMFILTRTNSPFHEFPITVTVLGARVNVNAVTTQTNQIAQDYALVISSDDTALTEFDDDSAVGFPAGPLAVLVPYAEHDQLPWVAPADLAADGLRPGHFQSGDHRKQRHTAARSASRGQ